MAKSSKKTRRDTYQEITDYVVDYIEKQMSEGSNVTALWSKSDVNIFNSKNAGTDREYNGINRLVLAISMLENDYTYNGWMTFKQAIDNGTPVKKGEKATKVIYFSTLEKENDKIKDADGNNTIEKIPYAKLFYVFNVSQLEGYDLSACEPKKQIEDFQTNEVAERIKDAMGVEIKHSKEQKAYYVPSKDFIMMPERDTFIAEEFYYRVLMHECIHATAHETRLDRCYKKNFETAKEAYALEELVADLGSAYLGAQIGIIADTLDSHADYLSSWLKALKNDKRFIFKAAAAAQKASDYMLDKAGLTTIDNAA